MFLTTRSDPDAETVLGFIDAEFVEKKISAEEIDWVNSANNCARLWKPLNEEKIEEYQLSMIRGDVFPRTVVESMKSGYVILGGNQRWNAAKRISSDVSMVSYVVRPLNLSQRETVIRSLNCRHGWGSEKSERMAHGVYLVMKHGATLDDCARLLNVSSDGLRINVKAEESRIFLARKGVDSGNIASGTLRQISSITDEKTAIAFAKVVIELASTEAQVTDAVKGIVAAPSQAERARLVKVFASEHESRKSQGVAKKMRNPRREKFIKFLKLFSEFLERGNSGTGFSSMDELQCNETKDGDVVRAYANKILIRLKTIAGVL